MLLRYWFVLIALYMFYLLIGSFMFNMIECQEVKDARKEEVEERNYISKFISDLGEDAEKLPNDLANLTAFLIRIVTEERFWDLENSIIEVLRI